MHVACYQERKDVRAVVHAHPPTAVAFSLSGIGMMQAIIPELVVTLGAIPTAPYGTPGTEELPDSLRSLIRCSDAILMERHGAMVLGVCRRVLGNHHDAEDACQATFLVLARKSSSIRKKGALSSWLHGVAFRIASDLKKRLTRRGSPDTKRKPSSAMATDIDVSWREVQCILDEELARLPENYRLPVVLCCLEGKARDEAAQQLGWSTASFRGRLDRGREMLRRQRAVFHLHTAAIERDRQRAFHLVDLRDESIELRELRLREQLPARAQRRCATEQRLDLLEREARLLREAQHLHALQRIRGICPPAAHSQGCWQHTRLLVITQRRRRQGRRSAGPLAPPRSRRHRPMHCR